MKSARATRSTLVPEPDVRLGPDGEPVTPTLHLSTTYRQGGDHEYIRDGSPTIEAFERVVGELEGGHAVAFSSGMAASAAVLDGLDPGARVLAPTVCYLGVRKLLAERARAGSLDVTSVDQTATEPAVAAIDDVAPALVWAETPNNPLLGISDVAGKYYVPELGSFLIYLVMLGLLMWRPAGLLGRR